MKKISVVIPTFNEEENVTAICDAVQKVLREQLPQYDYDIIFIDNDSQDRTRSIITELCINDKRVKAIYNIRNFGANNSPLYGLLQAEGDAVILLVADFQEPPELIPELVKNWEQGSKIVCAIKNKSKTNPFVHFLRSCYYKTIRKMSDVEQIEQFNGFGLYDSSFLEVLRQIDDPQPYLRGLVSEYGFQRSEVRYEQQKRRAGKSSFDFYKYYDFAMLGFTSYTKIGMRIATFAGIIVSTLSMLVALVYLVLKLAFWNSFPGGLVPILIGVFFLGGIQLLFIGFLGEYILAINSKVVKRPLVIEKQRINFD